MRSVLKVIFQILKAVITFISTLLVTMVIHNIFLQEDIYYIFNLVTSIVVTVFVMVYPNLKKPKHNSKDTNDHSTVNNNTINGPVGFGGWLILFSIGLTLQFFTIVKSFYSDYILINSDDFTELTTIGSENYNSLWFPLVMLEMITQVIATLFIVFIFVFMIKKSKKFKLITFIYISLMSVVSIIKLIIKLVIQNGYTVQIFTNEELYNPIFMTTIYAVIWIPYMLLSIRVKNTFIK